MRSRLFIKRLLFPGLDVGIRKRMRLARHFRSGDIATLDAGCGNGAFSFAAAKIGNRVLGIDSDAEKLRRCAEFRDYLGIPRKRCDFRTMSIFDLPSLGRTFDQIVCFETLEHIMDDAGAVRTLASVLTPGGTLHISTPTRERELYVGEVVSDTEDGGHVRLGYEAEELVALARHAGLEVVTQRTLVGRFSRFVMDTANRLDRALIAWLPDIAREAARLLALTLLYPLTFLDLLLPSRGLIAYVAATRP